MRPPTAPLGRVRRRWPLLAALTLACLPLGCRSFTKEAADSEVYGLLGERRAEVPDVRGTLDVEARERMADALRRRERFELSLRDALELGTVGSRDYRRQRESVYLAALDLTRELNRFRPLWDVGGSLDVSGDEDGSSIGGSLGLQLRRAFARGGSVVVGLASSFLRELSGDPLRAAQTVLSADVVLPLLRDSGELVARESLTQAERNVLYALRDYARFQQEFTVEIASRFYRALQARDGWQNAEARYRSLQVLVDEQRAKAVDRLPPFQVDQVEQDLLESDDARQRARNSFETAVDRLKLDLGIPVQLEVVLKDTDLEALRSRGPRPVAYDRARALALAAERRLDLHTARDRQADAERRVLVTKDALRAGLDLRLAGDLATPGEQPLDFASADGSGRVGLDFDLPFERTEERNTYRRALIEAGRARRDRERAEDTVVFEVRDAWRTVAEAERSFAIQEESLRLADRRVESTQLLLERGSAQTRDRLEAEDALVRARNAVTAALVDHALARLALERDVGVLRVDADGMWTEDEPGGTTPPAGGVQPGSAVAATPPAVVLGPAPISPTGTPAAGMERPRVAPHRPAPNLPAPRGAAPEEAAPAPPLPAPGASLPPPQVLPRRSATVGPR